MRFLASISQLIPSDGAGDAADACWKSSKSSSSLVKVVPLRVLSNRLVDADGADRVAPNESGVRAGVRAVRLGWLGLRVVPWGCLGCKGFRWRCDDGCIAGTRGADDEPASPGRDDGARLPNRLLELPRATRGFA